MEPLVHSPCCSPPIPHYALGSGCRWDLPISSVHGTEKQGAPNKRLPSPSACSLQGPSAPQEPTAPHVPLSYLRSPIPQHPQRCSQPSPPALPCPIGVPPCPALPMPRCPPAPPRSPPPPTSPPQLQTLSLLAPPTPLGAAPGARPGPSHAALTSPCRSRPRRPAQPSSVPSLPLSGPGPARLGSARPGAARPLPARPLLKCWTAPRHRAARWASAPPAPGHSAPCWPEGASAVCAQSHPQPPPQWSLP